MSGMARRPERAGSETEEFASVTVADCRVLAELATLGRCADGDVFLAEAPAEGWTREMMPRPGERIELTEDEDGGSGRPWTVPRAARTVPARTDPMGSRQGGILATPGALAPTALVGGQIVTYLRVSPGDRDAFEHARNAAAAIDPRMSVWALTAEAESERFTSIRIGLYLGMIATLVLLAASLLIGVLEQLRERRRLLAVLVAFGTRRATLAWSVLWQTAVPVAAGVGLAVATGLGLGAALLRLVEVPVRPDWPAVGVISGAGLTVVLLVTALSMPALWRMMRPDGLRTE
jgi:hypothetical protein